MYLPFSELWLKSSSSRFCKFDNAWFSMEDILLCLNDNFFNDDNVGSLNNIWKLLFSRLTCETRLARMPSFTKAWWWIHSSTLYLWFLPVALEQSRQMFFLSLPLLLLSKHLIVVCATVNETIPISNNMTSIEFITDGPMITPTGICFVIFSVNYNLDILTTTDNVNRDLI